MKIEQEVASIVTYVLDHTGNPFPYYYSIPEDFRYPAVYFPSPEFVTDGETFLTYGMEFVIYSKFFALTSEDAYDLALAGATAIRADRNLIPLIGEDGEPVRRGWIRIHDPSVKVIDSGAAQLTLSWRSRRPYNQKPRILTKIFHTHIYNSRYFRGNPTGDPIPIEEEEY